MKFVSRLLKPVVFAGCAAIAFGVFAGSMFAHNALYADISREYNIDREQWERWIGINTQTVIPYILIGAELSFLIVVALVPDRSERNAIRSYAYRRLGEPGTLSDLEIQLWNRVLDEVKHDEYL